MSFLCFSPCVPLWWGLNLLIVPYQFSEEIFFSRNLWIALPPLPRSWDASGGSKVDISWICANKKKWFAPMFVCEDWREVYWEMDKIYHTSLVTFFRLVLWILLEEQKLEVKRLRLRDFFSQQRTFAIFLFRCLHNEFLYWSDEILI